MDIHFNCPRCSQNLSVEERGAKMLMNGPNRKGQIEIPRHARAQVPNISLPSAPEKPPQPHVPPATTAATTATATTTTRTTTTAATTATAITTKINAAATSD
jgi:hypothetical protein